MSGVSAGELARIRDAFQATFGVGSAQIQRFTTTPDGAGSTTRSWSTIATVACDAIAREAQKPDERELAGTVGVTILWEVSLPAGTDVTITDRLIVGSRTLEVLGVLSRSTEIARRVICGEVL